MNKYIVKTIHPNRGSRQSAHPRIWKYVVKQLERAGVVGLSENQEQIKEEAKYKAKRSDYLVTRVYR